MTVCNRIGSIDFALTFLFHRAPNAGEQTGSLNGFYITGYEPIKDRSGAEIGIYYVGYKK